LSRFKFLTSAEDSQLARHVNSLRKELGSIDPITLATLTSVKYKPSDSAHGAFYFKVWGKEMQVSYPDFAISDLTIKEEPSTLTQALIIYYFHTADGSFLAGKWIAFSELPEGRFYSHAFQGYTGQQLLRTFKDDVESLAHSAEKLPRAESHFLASPVGNRSFTFQALPRIPLLLSYWAGDEDFPSNYQILFDASVIHYLPTDVCAILGSSLTRKLISQMDNR